MLMGESSHHSIPEANLKEIGLIKFPMTNLPSNAVVNENTSFIRDTTEKES